MVASAAVSLVSIDVVRFVLGIDAETALGLVDSGQLRWVWNMSADERSLRRELRFLESELSGTFVPKDVDTAVSRAIGVAQCKRIPCSRVEILWTCSNQNLLRLARNGHIAGEIEGRTRWLTVDSLRRFLTRRLVS